MASRTNIMVWRPSLDEVARRVAEELALAIAPACLCEEERALTQCLRRGRGGRRQLGRLGIGREEIGEGNAERGVAGVDQRDSQAAVDLPRLSQPR